MDQQDNDNGNDLPEARGQPAEAPEEERIVYFLVPAAAEEPLQAERPIHLLIPAAAEEPPQAERPIHPRPRRRRQLLAQYACNACQEVARGAVITICGHIFCWACLWPQLANKEEPKCPRCESHLVVQNDIVPMFGSPDDGDNVAEPGAVPRPAGICCPNPNDRRRQQAPMLAEVHPRIALILKYLSRLQVVCIILVGLICVYMPDD